MEKYYNMISDIINNYEKKNENYQLLMNLNNIKHNNENIIKDIDKIINEITLKKK